MLWIWIGISRDKEEGKGRCKNADVRKTTARAKTAAESKSKVRAWSEKYSLPQKNACIYLP
jgi:hypothetical protein